MNHVWGARFAEPLSANSTSRRLNRLPRAILLVLALGIVLQIFGVSAAVAQTVPPPTPAAGGTPAAGATPAAGGTATCTTPTILNPSTGTPMPDPNATPGAGCPPAAAPPAAAGGGGVNDTIGAAIGQWVGSSVATALTQVYNFMFDWIQNTSKISIADPNGWFAPNYRMMVTLGVWVMLPLVLVAIIHAVAKGSMEMLFKSVFVYVPVSIIGTVVAVEIVQLLLNFVDDAAEVFFRTIKADSTTFFDQLRYGFGAASTFNVFMVVLMGFLLLVVMFGVYVILIMRQASVLIATAFLPIGFACLVWPATTKHFRRMCEFLFAMILSKLIMVASISLALASLNGGVGLQTAGANGLAPNGTQTAAATPAAGQSCTSSQAPAASAAAGTPAAAAAATPSAGNQSGAACPIASTAAGSQSQQMVWFALVIQAFVMFLLIAIAPAMTMRLLGNLGFDEMGRHLNSHMDRPGVWRQLVFYNRMNDFVGATFSTQPNSLRSLRAAQQRRENYAGTTSAEEHRLALMAIERNAPGTFGAGTYEIERAALINAGFNDTPGTAGAVLMNDIMNWSRSNDANDIARAHAFLAAAAHSTYTADGTMGLQLETSTGPFTRITNNAGRNWYVMDVVDRTSGAVIDYIDPNAVDAAFTEANLAGSTRTTVITGLDASADATPGERANRLQLNAVARRHEAMATTGAGPPANIRFGRWDRDENAVNTETLERKMR